MILTTHSIWVAVPAEPFSSVQYIAFAALCTGADAYRTGLWDGKRGTGIEQLGQLLLFFALACSVQLVKHTVQIPHGHRI